MRCWMACSTESGSCVDGVRMGLTFEASSRADTPCQKDSGPSWQSPLLKRARSPRLRYTAWRRMDAWPKRWWRPSDCSVCQTAPTPIGGSWFSSPTSTSCAPSGRASSNAWARLRSTIDISSTTSRSRPKGCLRLRPNPPGLAWSKRCSVVQGRPAVVGSRRTASCRRRAALPVGAARWMRRSPRSRIARSNIAFTVLVLPVPGPPLSNTSR